MKYRWLFFFGMVLAFLLAASSTPVRATNCLLFPDVPVAECEALIDFYNETGGINWVNNNNWLVDETICNWYGVVCEFNGTNLYVDQLNLASNQLVGTVSSGLDNLTGLSVLNLSGNEIEVVQTLAFPNLWYLNLSSNNLTGAIPSWLNGTNFPALSQLQLNGNTFNGAVPASLATINTLAIVNLASNQLSGDLPDMSALSNLIDFSVFQNGNLTGNLSTWMNGTAFPNLESLNLSYNHFSGPIPDMTGAPLRFVNLGFNDWTAGPVPTWITSSTVVEYVTLTWTQRTGSFPTFASPALKQVLLNTNFLTGTLPASFNATNHPDLLYFSVYLNELEGAVPAEIGGFTQLLFLSLGANKFTSLPVELANLTSLPTNGVSLDVRYNGLPIIGIDTNLKNFLDTKNAGWGQTQTVAPINVTASAVDSDTVTLSWTPILFQAGPGRYDVGVSTTAGSGYVFGNVTADKTATGLTVEGLTPNTTYYFVVRTITDAQALQYPGVTSFNSAEASATTPAVNVTTNCAAVSEIPQAECQALVDLFNSADGVNWTTNTGWNSNNTPCSWFNVTCTGGHVTSLVLANNNLDGTLPNSLSALTSLDTFVVDFNPDLIGAFPLWILNVPTLTDLSVIGTGLDAGGANLSTSGIQNLTGLEFVQLGNLNFSGPIPNLSASPNLYWLNLGDTGLSGTVPAWISGATPLQRLVLSNNALTGTLPDMGALVNMGYFEINGTDITGSLPNLGSATNIFFISLANNRFTGSIPASYGNLLNLGGLNLEQNQLSGNIPTELKNLPNLGVGFVLSYVGFGYNALTIDPADTALLAYINAKDPDWADTQTVAPENVTAASTSATSITISWDAIEYVGNGGYYDVGYSVTAGGPYAFGSQTADKTATSLVINNLVPETTYHFVVRSHTPANTTNKSALTSDNSLQVSATTGSGNSTTPPTAPQLTGPADDFELVGDASPTFTWAQNPEAQLVTEYRLTITNSAGVAVFKEKFDAAQVCALSVCTVDLDLISPPTFLTNGNYSWRVRAFNSAGGTNSPKRQFTITFPGKPALVSPVDTTINDFSPVFVWSDVPSAAQYKLKVINQARDVVASTIWLDKTAMACDGTTCSYDITPTGLLNGKYKWQVIARNTAVSSSTSKSVKGSFTVSFPGIATLVSPPVDAVVSDTTPIFTWSEVTDATEYRLQVVRLTNNTGTVYKKWLTTAEANCAAGQCSLDLPVTLQGGQFKWRIQTRNTNFPGYVSKAPYQKFSVTP